MRLKSPPSFVLIYWRNNLTYQLAHFRRQITKNQFQSLLFFKFYEATLLQPSRNITCQLVCVCHKLCSQVDVCRRCRRCLCICCPASAASAAAAVTCSAWSANAARSPSTFFLARFDLASDLAERFPLPEFLFAPLFSCSLSSGFCSCAPLPPGWRLLSLPHLTSAAVPFSVPPPFTTAVHTHLFPHRRFYQRPCSCCLWRSSFLCASRISFPPAGALFAPLWSLVRTSVPAGVSFRVPLFLFAPLPLAVVFTRALLFPCFPGRPVRYDGVVATCHFVKMHTK